MVVIPCLKVPQRHAQLYKKYLQSQGVLELRYCTQKHSDGTVTFPVVASVLPRLDLVALKGYVAQEDSFCEIVDIQAPPLSKKGKVKSFNERLIETAKSLLVSKGETWSVDLERDIPSRWQCHGDMVLFGDSCFSNTIWREIGPEFWTMVAQILGVKRLAQIKKISQDGYRTPIVTVLLGDSSYVTHIDNHIRYEFDITKCMFSSGNITEKLRIASLDCNGETVVDLYAGIGYFTLPYLVHANASHVHACEWNPDAIKALHRNLQINGVSDRCTVHQGDNRQLPLSDLADRVSLGLIPSSEEGWPVACRLLKRRTGGILHIHQNVTTPLHHETPEHSSAIDVEQSPLKSQRDMEVWTAWARETGSRICTLLLVITGDKWTTDIRHIEHVKTYAPHISHVVLDLECRPL
ncbi:tRNA wybutosine-synthesizing protein 2 homolog [Triplophysa rosa]|uniref:tRNA wybutosine-synthesizing protein 2 homolog n=1 Tax=Triplophysa rosa TaxID=992332 RepID=A0A9W7WK37_TRIRA|nr:tRNA wybutosine-synthesizing protein 2 homolog [Triplophysa rosa]KAI7801855.1 tRNA wybutosine-synthesizing protein 2-like protein [Triplophysa rosa]